MTKRVHAAAKAAEAAAPEATEAAPAAARRVASTPTHGYEPRGRNRGVRQKLAAGSDGSRGATLEQLEHWK
jgi:hypothetical protein